MKIFLILIASISSFFCIAAEKTENKVDTKLIDAIIFKESSGRDDAVGDKGKAVGCLQIHPIMVKEVNRILKIKKSKIRYTNEDRLDRKKSIEMFVIYTNYWTPDWNQELVARRWNGGTDGETKPETEKYWEAVKKILKEKE